jgi:hypothetical protein
LTGTTERFCGEPGWCEMGCKICFEDELKFEDGSWGVRDKERACEIGYSVCECYVETG